jgi:hypothetical protein
VTAHAAGIDDIVSDARHGEIPHNGQDQENQVGRIGGTEGGLSRGLQLRNIQLEHLLLDLVDQRSEDVGNRATTKNIDIAGKPGDQDMMQAIEDGQTEDQRPDDGQDDQIKGPTVLMQSAAASNSTCSSSESQTLIEFFRL